MSYQARKVLRALRKHGCVFLREGGNHTIYRAPSGVEIVVPRHPQLDRWTVRGMAKDADIEWEEFRKDVS